MTPEQRRSRYDRAFDLRIENKTLREIGALIGSAKDPSVPLSAERARQMVYAAARRLAFDSWGDDPRREVAVAFLEDRHYTSRPYRPTPRCEACRGTGLKRESDGYNSWNGPCPACGGSGEPAVKVTHIPI